MNLGYLLGDEQTLLQLTENQKGNTAWTLVYVRSGRGMYIIDGDLRALNEGDLLLFSPGVSFSFATRDLGDEYNVNLTATVFRFDSNWLESLLAVFPVCRELILKLREVVDSYTIRGPKWIKISSLLDDVLTCRSYEQPIKIFAILRLLSSPEDMFLLRKAVQIDAQDVTQRKIRIDRYIECNFCDKVSLEDISNYVGMSRTYFCNFFKVHYGEGFADYLNRLRVEKATVLLANTDRTLEQIAGECGFKTVQYFTRSFAKVKQVTPGAFRKAAKI